MAKIIKTDAAPKDLGPISLANDTLDFGDKNEIETDNYNLISNAREIPYLEVQESEDGDVANLVVDQESKDETQSHVSANEAHTTEPKPVTNFDKEAKKN